MFFITGAVATPSGETKEFTFAAPPVSHTIPTLATSGSFHYVDLYLKASTSGARGVEVKASYNGNKVLANRQFTFNPNSVASVTAPHNLHFA